MNAPLVARVRGSWCTPREIVDPLMSFTDGAPVGLDPCSNERSIVPATRVYTLADGLEPSEQHWGSDSVYCNPDFADTSPWMRKIVGHAGWAIACVLCDPSVSWWEHVWKADAICFPKRRIAFDPPPGVKRSTFPRPIALPFFAGANAHSWDLADGLRVAFEHAFRRLGKVVML